MYGQSPALFALHRSSCFDHNSMSLKRERSKLSDPQVPAMVRAGAVSLSSSAVMSTGMEVRRRIEYAHTWRDRSRVRVVDVVVDPGECGVAHTAAVVLQG